MSLPRVRYRTQSFAISRFSASRHSGLTNFHKNRHPQINWISIAGLRNVLVHDYFEVDFETVWDVVVWDLPSLEKVLRAILAELE
jgi:uncharacterized protein with HEPN domain